MQKAEFWIESLKLSPHPEGGFYRETWRTIGSYAFTKNSSFNGVRSYATAIYYLLKGTECSKLHKINSDELWFFHAGDPLTVHVFHETGKPTSFILGHSPEEEQVLQALVPAGAWFGACLDDATAADHYALVSCVVAPGFDFSDFAFADRDTLLNKFPQHLSIIERLT
ncbi:MAG: cupin domain-containing protein [Chlorobiaceae bacterium]